MSTEIKIKTLIKKGAFCWFILYRHCNVLSVLSEDCNIAMLQCGK